MNKLISELYKEYESYSKEHLSNNWFNFKGWSKRLFGNTDYYVDLIFRENEVIKKYKIFAIKKLQEQDKLSKESISEIVIAMKNHRERIVSRSSYLVILAASFGLITALTGVSLSTGLSSGILPSILIICIIIALVVLLVERDKLNIHATTTQELINILDFVKNEELENNVENQESASNPVSIENHNQQSWKGD